MWLHAYMRMHFSLNYHILDELECSPHSLNKIYIFKSSFKWKWIIYNYESYFLKTRAILTNIWWKKELTATLPQDIKNCQWSLVIAANFVFVMLQTSVSIQT